MFGVFFDASVYSLPDRIQTMESCGRIIILEARILAPDACLCVFALSP